MCDTCNTHIINRIKEKTSQCRKSFDKIHEIMINNIEQGRNKRILPQHNKSKIQKPHSEHHTQW